MGPGEIVAQRAATDPRVGGRYRIEMHSPNGEPHNVGGAYREVVANEKLVFTWSWDAAPPESRMNRWSPCCSSRTATARC